MNPNLVNPLVEIFKNVGTSIISSSNNLLKGSNPLDKVEKGGIGHL